MVKQKTVYNFFKFLEDKRGEKMPLQLKLVYDPKGITKEDLNVKQHLEIEGRKFNIKELPNNLKIEGALIIHKTKIKKLPDDIEVGFGVYASYSELEYLPNNLHTEDVICNHSKLQDIPYNLRIDRTFNVANTPLTEKYSKEEIRKLIEDRGGYVKGRIMTRWEW